MYPSENCPKSQFDLPAQKLITVKANEGVKVCVYPKTPTGVENVIYLYDHKPEIGSKINPRNPLKPNYLDDEIISGQGEYIKKPFSAEIEIDKSRTIEKIRDGQTTFYVGVLDKGVTAVTSQPLKVVE